MQSVFARYLAYNITILQRIDITVSSNVWSMLYVTLLNGKCRRGLVVGRPTAVREDPGSNLTVAGRVYHDSHCDMQPWAWVVHPYCSA